MKYTIVIRHPVDADRLPELEQQLTGRFGLNADQAQRLASRRAGRLMKPTTRPRAELLLDVFQSVGADVGLESVTEDTRQLAEPFQGVASLPAAGRAPDAHDDTMLAPLLPAAAWPAPTAAATPVGSPAASGGLTATLSAPPETAPPPERSVSENREAAPDLSVFGGTPTAAVREGHFFLASPSSEAAPPVESADVWSDFMGGLSLPETEKTPQATGAGVPSITPMLGAGVSAGEDGAPSRLRRNSLTRQLTVGALIPLTLASAVTLGVLALTLPAMQRQVVQANARNVAAAVGANLSTGSQSQAYVQIDGIIAGSEVGFIQVELPGGVTYLRSRNSKLNDSLNTQVSAWTRGHPQGGTLKLTGTEYVASRVTFKEDRIGRAVATPVNAADDQYLRRITVGLPNAQAAINLRNTLLLVLAASLLGLVLAGLFATRSARQVTEPIERLVRAADAISMGDLSRPVQATRNDEIGDLAQALERMRLSLEAAMERLRRRRRG